VIFEKITHIFFILLCDKRGELAPLNFSEEEPYHPPDHALEALARCLYPAIVAYFESEQGQREFAEWKKRQGSKKIKNKPK